MVITHIRGLISPLITTHELPSRPLPLAALPSQTPCPHDIVQSKQNARGVL